MGGNKDSVFGYKDAVKRLRNQLQQLIYCIINPFVRLLIKLGITPNIVTTIGFLGNAFAAGLFVYAAETSSPDDFRYGTVLLAGVVIILFSLFDMLDGQVARLGNMVSRFGAFYDSVLDRYSELLTLGGICYYFFALGYRISAGITFVAIIGSIMVSYMRARAEGLDIECKIGFMQRPERVVVTALGAIICGWYGSVSVAPCFVPVYIMVGAVSIIAVFSNITAIARLQLCRRVLKSRG